MRIIVVEKKDFSDSFKFFDKKSIGSRSKSFKHNQASTISELTFKLNAPTLQFQVQICITLSKHEIFKCILSTNLYKDSQIF